MVAIEVGIDTTTTCNVPLGRQRKVLRSLVDCAKVNSIPIGVVLRGEGAIGIGLSELQKVSEHSEIMRFNLEQGLGGLELYLIFLFFFGDPISLVNNLDLLWNLCRISFLKN